MRSDITEIYNSRNLLMKFEKYFAWSRRKIYNSRNLLMKFESAAVFFEWEIYNSRNLLMKFEFYRANVTATIYNSRNLLMKFESEKVIFKPKRCNTLPIEHRLLGLKSFHKKIKTEVCIPPNVITKISTER